MNLVTTKAKRKAKHDVNNYPKIDKEQQEYTTPESDDAMIKYIKDSLIWLDSMDGWD